MWLLFGNFWGILGYFKVLHLVTLIVSKNSLNKFSINSNWVCLNTY